MNVKKDDLAIIIKARCKANLMAIVQVCDRAPDDDQYGAMWITKFDRPSTAYNRKTDSFVKAPAGTPILTPDAWLRPVSGLPMEEQIADQEVA